MTQGVNGIDMASGRSRTSIKVSRETRDRVKRLKTGGETYDDLLRQMAEQYDPAQERSVGKN